MKFILLVGIVIALFGYALAQPTPEQQVNENVIQIARSGDGKLLAVTHAMGSSLSTLVKLYDSSNGQLLRTIDLSPVLPFLIALSPDGNQITYGTHNFEHGVVNTMTGDSQVFISGGATGIETLEWNPVNDKIAFSVGSGVHISDLADPSAFQMVGSSPRILAIDWSPDGRYLATSHYSENPFDPEITYREINIWDVTANSSEQAIITPILTIENEGGALEWSSDGTKLAISRSGLLIYNIAHNSPEVYLPDDEKPFYTAVWHPDGHLLATGGNPIRIWDTENWEIVRTIAVEYVADALQWSSDGEHIFHNGGTQGLYWDEIPVSQLDLPSYTEPPLVPIPPLPTLTELDNP